MRGAILEAATTCSVFDPQVNGLRADWLAALCVEAGLVDAILARVPPDSGWDLDQHCALLGELARVAPVPAREALYVLCRRGARAGQTHGCAELIELDGADGLVWVATRLGEALLGDAPPFLLDPGLLEQFDRGHAAGAARALLEERALSVPAIRAYLDGVDRLETRPVQRRPTAPRESLAAVLATIATATTPQHWIVGWARSCAPAEREAVQELLETLTDSVAVMNALRVFRRQPLARATPRVVALLSHEDASVRDFAATALGPLRDEELRRAALSAIARGDLSAGITALRGSARPGDGALVQAALTPVEDDDAEHAVVMALLEYSGAQRASSEALLLHVYERSPCMRCREEAVKLLVEAGRVPAWVREECTRDASGRVRGLLGSSGALPALR